MLGMNTAFSVRISKVLTGNLLAYNREKIQWAPSGSYKFLPVSIPTYNTCHIVVVPLSDPTNHVET